MQTELGPPEISVAVASRLRRPEQLRVETVSPQPRKPVQEGRQGLEGGRLRPSDRSTFSAGKQFEFEQLVEKFRPGSEAVQVDGRDSGKPRGRHLLLGVLRPSLDTCSAQCYKKITAVKYVRKVCCNVIKYVYGCISRQQSHLAAKIRA